jgi:hypothetical protein
LSAVVNTKVVAAKRLCVEHLGTRTARSKRFHSFQFLETACCQRVVCPFDFQSHAILPMAAFTLDAALRKKQVRDNIDCVER